MNFLPSRRGIQEQGGSSSSKGMYYSSSSSSASYHNHQPPRNELMLMESSSNIHGDGSEPLADSGEANNNDVIEREHMFDKVVTPSDVGKLNRLVIPKQHAEKYFPLDNSSSNVDNKAGLLLNFEDRNGKPWRFRYSYWNSSQSYVMTKGWSRFVKEKKLDAGDIVSFQRGAGELGKHRLFIDWRRRPDHVADHMMMNPFMFRPSNPLSNWSHHRHHPFFLQPPPSSVHSRLLLEAPGSSIAQQQQQHYSQLGYCYGIGNTTSPNYYSTTATMVNARPSGSQLVPPQQRLEIMQMQRAVGMEPMVYNSVPVVQGKVAAKRLRLFGVNMDCPMNISDLDDSDDLMSSTVSLLNPTTTMGMSYSHAPNFSSTSTSIPDFRNINNYGNSLPSEESCDKGNKASSSMSLDLEI